MRTIRTGLPETIAKRFDAFRDERGWSSSQTARYLISIVLAEAPVMHDNGRVITPSALCAGCPLHGATRTIDRGSERC